ncbi:DUF6538 domain-containing protein [Desulfovibrio caledoniensis]
MRRGSVYHFRLVVPDDLKDIFNRREFLPPLRT